MMMMTLHNIARNEVATADDQNQQFSTNCQIQKQQLFYGC
jgi:hypothetical protein